MSAKKLALICCCCTSFLVAQASFAATCLKDRKQMLAQINEKKSISTNGCPKNSLGWGIDRISKPQQLGNQCLSTCYYPQGQGSKGVPCFWKVGSWGNTLTCQQTSN